MPAVASRNMVQMYRRMLIAAFTVVLAGFVLWKIEYPFHTKQTYNRGYADKVQLTDSHDYAEQVQLTETHEYADQVHLTDNHDNAEQEQLTDNRGYAEQVCVNKCIMELLILILFSYNYVEYSTIWVTTDW